MISPTEKAKVIKLLVSGYSKKDINRETGISETTIKRIKKELKSANSSSSKTISDNGESSFDDSDYITQTEQKYILKLEGELELFTDADEGWVFHLTANELKKKTSGLWWIAIMYPTDEDPDGKKRIDRLRFLGLELAISPLHDKDTKKNKETGKFEPKKAHWHIIIKCRAKMSFREINEIIRDITEGPYLQKCLSIKGQYEYFTHLNHPDKYPYESSEIQEYNGFTIEANRNERNALFDFIAREVYEHQEIDTMGKLMAIHFGETEVMGVISSKGYTLKMLLQENWHKNNPDYVKEIKIRKD